MGTPDNGGYTAAKGPEISVFFDIDCSIIDILYQLTITFSVTANTILANRQNPSYWLY